MSSQDSGIPDASAVVNSEKKEKKEKKEKVPGEKKVKAAASVQGIEEIREVRVQKVATMREAGNRKNIFCIVNFASSLIDIRLSLFFFE